MTFRHAMEKAHNMESPCQHRDPETGDKDCPNSAVPGGSFCYDHGGRP